MYSQANSTQTFKEVLIPTLVKVFQKLKREEKTPNSLYEATLGHSLKKRTTGQYL